MVPIITPETHTEPKHNRTENSGIRNLPLYHKITFARNYPQLFATDLPAGVFLACFCRNCLHVLSRSN